MNSITQLKNSVRCLRKKRPAYGEILDFYAAVFLAQEKSKETLALPPAQFDAGPARFKKDGPEPFIRPGRFRIDEQAAEKMLKTICGLALIHAPRLAEDAERILGALGNGTMASHVLFRAVLENARADLEHLGAGAGVGVSQLNLFGFLSLSPCIQAGAARLAGRLDDGAVRHRSDCPVCGHPPDLAVLDGQGKRRLKCSFCNHEWAVKRMGCVFCGNTDPDLQPYFFSSEEKEYRVNLCDHCNTYIKVVDLRQMDRYFYPALELVSTLHLDLKAREKGYVSRVLP